MPNIDPKFLKTFAQEVQENSAMLRGSLNIPSNLFKNKAGKLFETLNGLTIFPPQMVGMTVNNRDRLRDAGLDTRFYDYYASLLQWVVEAYRLVDSVRSCTSFSEHKPLPVMIDKLLMEGEEREYGNKKISLIVPSRERLELLLHFIYTTCKRAKNIENIEIVLVVDQDDHSGLNDCPLHEAHKNNGLDYQAAVDASCVTYRDRIESFLNNTMWGSCVKIIERTGSSGMSENNNDECYNLGASYATGDLIWALGDDCEILNDAWDETILKHSMEFEERLNYLFGGSESDGAYYIKVSDGSHEGDSGKASTVCAFPVISRSSYDKLGFLALREFYSWLADFALYEVYSNSKIPRIFNLSSEIQVAHYSHHSTIEENKRAEDDINRKMNVSTMNVGSMQYEEFLETRLAVHVAALDGGV